MAAKCRWLRMLLNEASTSAVRFPIPTGPSIPEPQRYGTTSSCHSSVEDWGEVDCANAGEVHSIKPAATPTTRFRVLMFRSFQSSPGTYAVKTAANATADTTPHGIMPHSNILVAIGAATLLMNALSICG